ncbi:MAG TPA: penicillin acylase family protein [Myxococcota bacterium]|nr:penicillin acylase family protein [Myxococcota bacterium]HRY96806.1 penicillin acylase family protein [Myxococcota bacterium]HSA21834.1 penicillin acylase family protein [Myxococcota bacterium]
MSIRVNVGWRGAYGLVALLALGAGCDEGGGGPATRIEDLPIQSAPRVAGLSAPVDVVYDDRGIPHIYAATLVDAFRAQGYLMARDRMGQMEFLRRGVTGRLAEVAGSLDPSLVQGDVTMRVLGIPRQARAIWESLAGDEDMREGLQAFSDGVTAYIDELRAGTSRLPGILPELLPAAMLTDWTPEDTLALARYQTYNLSFTAWDEIDRSLAQQAVAAAFPGDSPDPRLAARAGLFTDLWPLAPAEVALTRADFLGPPPPRPAPLPPGLRPSLPQLQAAHRFAAALRRFDALQFGPERGSNNWAVAGAGMASGLATLASNPHLGLSSPPVFWFVHLNTARAGGDWDTLGLAFAGTPGITLGFNRDIAWGATVSNFDVTDVYQEVITAGAAGAPDTVLFDGAQVPLTRQHEVVRLNAGDPVEFDVEFVPHHGPILPSTRTADSALSVRWVGEQPSNEIACFLGLATARGVQDIQAALEHFEVGGQNFMFATSAGDIYWSTHAEVPVRDARALAWTPGQPGLPAPDRVLPGTGEYEWQGSLDHAHIPTAENPADGFLATANQDQVGTNSDGNPFNDPVYLGWGFDLGHRMARIKGRLAELTARGAVTTEELSALQGDHRSPLGAALAPALVSALAALLEERDAPGSHPDLAALVAEAGPAGLGELQTAHDRLAAWSSFLAPSGLEHEASAAQVADSVAASLFNASLVKLAPLALGDELARTGLEAGQWPDGQAVARTLAWAVNAPERLASYDAASGQSVLWDDLDTEPEVETRDERLARAVWLALQELESRLGADPAAWQWGRLHTLRLKTLIPVDRFGADTFSIPPPGDPAYPDGFPRHGDNFTVDPANFGLWDPDSFGYSHGPTQRLVAEMGPDGPRAWNALPGGQQHDPAGLHHADEMERWRRNEAPPLAYEELDVVTHAERRIQLVP